MILVLDDGSEEPFYLQIYRQILAAVVGGQVPVGTALPSTRRLASDLSVNYHTVHKAYDLLRVRGVITMAPRGKAVVCRPDPLGPPDEWLTAWESSIRGLLAEGLAVGLSAGELGRRCRSLIESLIAGSPAPPGARID